MAADPRHHFQEGPGSKLLCCFKPFVGSLSFNKLLWPINRRLRKDNAHYLQLSGTSCNKNNKFYFLKKTIQPSSQAPTSRRLGSGCQNFAEDLERVKNPFLCRQPLLLNYSTAAAATSIGKF